MCIICAQMAKDLLTATEAARNLAELIDSDGMDNEVIEHIPDVLDEIEKKAIKEINESKKNIP